MVTEFNCEHGVSYRETCAKCIQEATIENIFNIIDTEYRNYKDRVSHTFISILKLKIQEYFKWPQNKKLENWMMK